MTSVPIDRRARLLEGVSPASDRGFEIGPLSSPIVDKGVAPDIVYVDHASTADLRVKYGDDAGVGEIVEVDVVWAEGTLADAAARQLAQGGPFRFGVASHVIEHVPNLVGWLHELAEVLEAGGTMHLAIPDKRFCFDVRRTETDFAEVLDAHLSGRTRPTTAMVFDFWTRYDQVDVPALWAGAQSPTAPIRDDLGLEKALAASGSATYTDVHCWVFTPTSFLDVLERMVRLDLCPFGIRSFVPTAVDDLEFFVVLERLPDGLTAEDRRARQLADLDRARAVAAPAPLSRDLPSSERPRRTPPSVARGFVRRLRRIAGATR